MLATLRQRDFALLWTGGLISFTGNWMLFAALPYYVYQQTGSTLATSAIIVASILPSVLLSSVAGVFVDRWDRKRVMVISNLVQTLAVLLLLLVRGGGSLWVVYAVALLQSMVGTFMGPAESALLPRLVDQQHLLSANALNSLNNNLARLLGPPLGGMLLARFGLGAVVIGDSLSFLIAAVLIAAVTADTKPVRDGAEPLERTNVGRAAALWAAFWREWLDGLALMRGSRLIVTLMVVLGITTFGGTMFDPLYPPFVEDVLRGGPQGFGWLLTAYALGGIFGGFVIGHLSISLPTQRILGWGSIMVGVLLLVQFNIPALPLALAIAFLIGPEQVAARSALQTLMQESVADAYRGRVFGAMGTTGALLSVLGAGLAGPLGEAFGIVPTLNLAAALTILAGVLALVLLPRP